MTDSRPSSTLVPARPDDKVVWSSRPYRDDPPDHTLTVVHPDDTQQPSERHRWLQGVKAHQERAERTRALRARLAVARAEGKRRRHAERLRRTSLVPNQPLVAGTKVCGNATEEET